MNSDCTLLLYHEISQQIQYTEEPALQLPKTVIPTSLVVLSQDRRPIDFEFHGASTPFEKGTQVALMIDDSIYEGYLVQNNENGVVIQEMDGPLLQAKKYDILAEHEINEYPSIHIIEPYTSKNMISFLFHGVKWFASYSIFVDEQRIKTIIANANIENNTKETIKVDTLEIISGDVNLPKSNPSTTAFVSHMSTGQKHEQPVNVDFSDYDRYIIKGPLTLHSGLSIFKISKIENPENQQYVFFCDVDKPTMQFGYRLYSEEFFSQGRAMVFDESNRFIGASYIENSVSGKPIDIKLGSSNHMYCTHEVQKSNINKDIMEYEITFHIHNNTGQEQIIILSIHVPNTFFRSNPTPSQRTEDEVEWQIYMEKSTLTFMARLYTHVLHKSNSGQLE